MKIHLNGGVTTILDKNEFTGRPLLAVISKLTFKAITLTHFGAKASSIYNPPLDRNELEPKDSSANKGLSICVCRNLMAASTD